MNKKILLFILISLITSNLFGSDFIHMSEEWKARVGLGYYNYSSSKKFDPDGKKVASGYDESETRIPITISYCGLYKKWKNPTMLQIIFDFVNREKKGTNFKATGSGLGNIEVTGKKWLMYDYKWQPSVIWGFSYKLPLGKNPLVNEDFDVNKKLAVSGPPPDSGESYISYAGETYLNLTGGISMNKIIGIFTFGAETSYTFRYGPWSSEKTIITSGETVPTPKTIYNLGDTLRYNVYTTIKLSNRISLELEHKLITTTKTTVYNGDTGLTRNIPNSDSNLGTLLTTVEYRFSQYISTALKSSIPVFGKNEPTGNNFSLATQIEW
ncbi:MAG: hypothetical protein WC947_01370 [Elusimicrobiota bacterium]